jgi:hypothetical protein
VTAIEKEVEMIETEGIEIGKKIGGEHTPHHRRQHAHHFSNILFPPTEDPILRLHVVHHHHLGTVMREIMEDGEIIRLQRIIVGTVGAGGRLIEIGIGVLRIVEGEGVVGIDVVMIENGRGREIDLHRPEVIEKTAIAIVGTEEMIVTAIEDGIIGTSYSYLGCACID